MEPHRLVDRSVLDSLRGNPGDPVSPVLQEVLHLYRKAAPSLLLGIRNGLAAGDGAAVERAAHSLRGSSLNVGATALAEALTAVEDAAGRRDLEGVRTRLDDLEDLLRRTLKALEAETAP